MSQRLYEPAGLEFVGRETTLRALQRALEMGRTVLLSGGPRLGKTSVLHRLERLLRERWVRQPSATKLVPVMLDARGWAQDPGKWVRGIHAGLHAIFSEAEVGQGVDVLAFTLPKRLSDDPWDDLGKSLGDFYGELQGTKAWCRYVLLIDDADELSGLETESLQRSMEAYLGETADWGPFAAVLAGSRSVGEIRLDRYNPLRKFRTLDLGLFTERETSARISARFPDAPAALRREIFEVSGGHPFVLECMIEAWTEAEGELSVQEALGVHGEDIEELFEEIWDAFDMERGVSYRGAYAAPEHALMQLLIETGKPIPLGQAERELAIKGLKEYATFLAFVGACTKHIMGDATALEASFALWNQWYSERITD